MISYWKSSIFILSLFLVGILLCDSPNAAEADSLYFTSATDMIEKVNSVIDVCDTSYGHRVVSVITCDWFGRAFVETKANELFRIITCRELIGVVKVKDPVIWEGLFQADFVAIPLACTTSGQMVVWWREVVQ